MILERLRKNEALVPIEVTLATTAILSTLLVLSIANIDLGDLYEQIKWTSQIYMHCDYEFIRTPTIFMYLPYEGEVEIMENTWGLLNDAVFIDLDPVTGEMTDCWVRQNVGYDSFLEGAWESAKYNVKVLNHRLTK